MARTAGDDPVAVAAAVDVLDRLGARPAAAHGRARLRRLGVTSVPRGPRPATAANPAGLTGREHEVLELVAAGLTNPQIAGRLFLSGKTVERHVSAVLRKLGAGTRAEAVAAGRRAGPEQTRRVIADDPALRDRVDSAVVLTFQCPKGAFAFPHAVAPAQDDPPG